MIIIFAVLLFFTITLVLLQYSWTKKNTRRISRQLEEIQFYVNFLHTNDFGMQRSWGGREMTIDEEWAYTNMQEDLARDAKRLGIPFTTAPRPQEHSGEIPGDPNPD